VFRDFPVPAAEKVKRKKRFHLLGLVHLPVSERYMGCAFTQKIVKMAKMLMSLGHEVVLYGAESSDVPCSEFVQTHTLSDIRSEWGEGDNRFDIGYNWKATGFRHDFNAARTKTWLRFNEVAIEEINKRKREDDFLLLTQGSYQKPVANGVDLYMTCEPGIGYRGPFARFQAFESAYLMNFIYGSRNPFESVDGSHYNRVIPNYFDRKDFPFQPEKEDYYLYVGRIIRRKGIWYAINAVGHVGGRLKIAGQVGESGIVDRLPPHCEFVGYVDPEKRAELMGKALAVFVPTIYLEAFGGVNVEAQLCGTPAITTDFGVFPETVVHGVTGFRCSSMDDFVQATRLAPGLDPEAIRAHAERYLMDHVKWEFEKWFEDIYQNYLSVPEFHDEPQPGFNFVEKVTQ
jgi:glycosyltransferase involved in cell wall biosynthesis